MEARRPRRRAPVQLSKVKQKKPRAKQRPSRHHSLEEMADALETCHGMITLAARQLDMTPQGVRMRVNEHPELQVILAEAKEHMKDRAESRLLDCIEGGEGWAICFYLKTQAKDRGYIERTELSNSPDQDFRVTIQAVPWRTALEGFLPPEEDDAEGPVRKVLPEA